MPLNIQLSWVKNILHNCHSEGTVVFLGIMLSFQLLFPSFHHFWCFPPWSYFNRHAPLIDMTKKIKLKKLPRQEK